MAVRTNRRLSSALLAAFVVAVLGTIAADLLGARGVAAVGLAALMPIVIALLLSSGVRARLITWTVVALIFSWLGDTAGGFTLLVKIIFFLAAQIAYTVAFWPYARRSLLFRPIPLVAFVLGLGALIAYVGTGAGWLTVPVVVYGGSLGLMVVLATGLGRVAALGAALFLISDIVLAVQAFVAPGLIPHVHAVNVALYGPAQVLLAVAALAQARADQETRTAAAGIVGWTASLE